MRFVSLELNLVFQIPLRGQIPIPLPILYSTKAIHFPNAKTGESLVPSYPVGAHYKGPVAVKIYINSFPCVRCQIRITKHTPIASRFSWYKIN